MKGPFPSPTTVTGPTGRLRPAAQAGGHRRQFPALLSRWTDGGCRGEVLSLSDERRLLELPQIGLGSVKAFLTHNFRSSLVSYLVPDHGG